MSAVLGISKLERFLTSRFCRYFFWIALASHLAWYLLGFSWPYHWTLLTSLLAPLVVCLIGSRSSDEATKCLCGWSREDMASKDKLTDEMNKIRFLKTKGNFDKALARVNHVLNQYPNSADALYLKAHLLWEGFKNPWAAESYFRRVIELTEDGEPVRSWASSCLTGIYSKVSQ